MSNNNQGDKPQITLPEIIYFDSKSGSNGINCLDYKNESEVAYIRQDLVKEQDEITQSKINLLEKENLNLSKGYDDWHNLYCKLKERLSDQMIALAGNLTQKYGSLDSLEKRMIEAEKRVKELEEVLKAYNRVTSSTICSFEKNTVGYIELDGIRKKVNELLTPKQSDHLLGLGYSNEQREKM